MFAYGYEAGSGGIQGYIFHGETGHRLMKPKAVIDHETSLHGPSAWFREQARRSSPSRRVRTLIIPFGGHVEGPSTPSFQPVGTWRSLARGSSPAASTSKGSLTLFALLRGDHDAAS